MDGKLSEEGPFEPPGEIRERAYVKSMAEYEELYRMSLDEPERFWRERAQELDWNESFDSVLSCDPGSFHCGWFEGGRLNVAHNCLDRHCERGLGDKTALIWEPDEPGEGRRITYSELLSEVERFGSVLRRKGVEKGDRVCLYMPMIPELPVAMLACARIGAVHSVVFAGFSPKSLRGRILDSEPGLLVTADAGIRGGKTIPLKENVDSALEEPTSIDGVIVVRRAGTAIEMREGRDSWWHEEMEQVEGEECPVVPVDSEDPLFILYTSGSTGKPKGVLHTAAGYLLYASLTHRLVFDVHDDDVWWCTADIGWITGHSYIVYGPLANGATSVIFEGVPTYPEPDRYWRICEEYGVTGFYTAPTVIRSLMRLGDDWTTGNDLSRLRVLGSVGEPINPDVWLWYRDRIGAGRCPVVDTWWQTETGGIMIAPLAGATPTVPGSASRPFFGVEAEVLTEQGEPAGENEDGYLVVNRSWPGMLRAVWGRPEALDEIYLSKFPGRYLTGDGCRIDPDGNFWLLGRIDDVINVSGHRIGTAEVESAIIESDSITEAAVVGVPHDVKGQGIYAFVTLKEGAGEDEVSIRDEISRSVRNEIGAIADPDVVQFTPALPKTRSGKIMRRILRNIARGRCDDLGDTSTLADPSVVDDVIEGSVDEMSKLHDQKAEHLIYEGYCR